MKDGMAERLTRAMFQTSFSMPLAREKLDMDVQMDNCVRVIECIFYKCHKGMKGQMDGNGRTVILQ